MKSNKVTYFNLIMVAIFTLLSFVFDQLVINSEDKIRDYNFFQKKSHNNYLKTKNISTNLYDLKNRAIFQANTIERKENFLSKVNKLIMNKDYVYKYYNVQEYGDSFLKNLRSIFLNRYKGVFYELIFEADQAKNIFMGLAIRPLEYSQPDILTEEQKKSFDKLNKKILDESMKFFSAVDIKFNVYRNFVADNFDSIDNNNLNKITVKYNEAKVIYNKELMKNLDNLLTIYNYFWNFYFKDSTQLLEKINKLKQKQNLYILLSVLSQILSLFFLIFLFKSLMKTELQKIKR